MSESAERPGMSRRVGSSRFLIDANCINAKQLDADLNQLETWRENGVIRMDISDVAAGEAAKGNAARSRKTMNRIRTGTLLSPGDERHQKIEKILWPKGAENQNQLNDVTIVFNAKKNAYQILITNDRDILRHAGRLATEIGITVMRPKDAVARVRQQIDSRDARIARACERSGESLPEWVGKD